MPWSSSVRRRVAPQPHVGGIGGKHNDAVSEASVELPVFELESSGERKSIQQGGGGAAGAAEESSLGALAILSDEGKGGHRPSVWAWAECRESKPYASMMTTMVSGHGLG
jgi:hypothetical protein